MQEATKPTAPLPVSRLVSLVRPELPLIAVATVSLLVGSASGLVGPQAARWLMDALTEPEPTLDVDGAALALLGVFTVQAVFTMLRAWLFTMAGERVVARLRTDLFRALVGQEVAFFDQSRTGELTSRLVADTTVLQNTVTVNLSMALRFTIQAFGAVILMFWMAPGLTALSLAVVPVVAAGAAVLGRVIRDLSKRSQDALAQSTTVAEETLGSVRTVRAFAREAAEVERYGEAVQRSYGLAARVAFAYGAFNGTVGFAGYAALALVLWSGGHQVLDGQMTVGDLTAFLLYTLTIAMSVGALSGLYGDFMRASGASQRVFELIDRDRGLEARGGRVLDQVVGGIRFDHVGFRYPTRPDVAVLTSFDLDIQPGEVVALVGHSGSGKSTVAALLSRFYDPNEGRILLDGAPLTELEPRSVREHVGVVSQEPVLFASSIADNIRYGRPGASLDEVKEAAKAANALSFIEDFPEGFDTLVGERGVRLSGGQKQRIAIARAVLKDPRILVLDEATSALDAESEHLVQEALERLMQGRTTLVIAHRLSTVRNADRVVVLDKGCIVEQGCHNDLVSHDGPYKRLVERQFADVAAK